MAKKDKKDIWIDSEILSDSFFVALKEFVEQVHVGKTGILSWLFFCKYFSDFQETKKPLYLALAIKEQPCILDHPVVRYQVIAWTLQSKYPSVEDKLSLKEFALGLGDYNAYKKSKSSIPFISNLKLINANSVDIYKELDILFDIIYLDPMYPILKKNVKKSGEISAIRSILEIENLIDDEDNIISNFMKFDCKKLILKRPLKSKKIYSNINYQVKGSTTKFDIYI